MFGNCLSPWAFGPGTRVISCAPFSTVIVFAAFAPNTRWSERSPLCASRMPPLTVTVPLKAVLLSLETTSLPAPVFTTSKPAPICAV